VKKGGISGMWVFEVKVRVGGEGEMAYKRLKQANGCVIGQSEEKYGKV
jgi:hypothetical protein